MISTFACASSCAAAMRGASSNCASPSGEREIWVTAKREKWTVIWWVGEEALREVIRAWVSGSRAVLEEGTRIPRRRRVGGIFALLGGEL